MSTPDAPPPLEVEEPMSLGERLLNVFAAPGDAFEDVARAEHCLWNWLLPMILTMIVGVVSVNVMFSQPAIVQQISEQQAKAIQEQVDSGKRTKEQAKAASDAMEKMGPTMMKVGGSIGAVVGTAIWLFLQTLGLWLLARLLWKSTAAYSKVLEVAGLASLVSLLGGAVTMLLVVATGKMLVTPGPALLVQNFDPTNKAHMALASLNVMTLWYVGVLAMGLAKATGRSFGAVAPALYAAWLALRVAFVASGLAAQGM